MDLLVEFLWLLADQLRSPTLAFLIGGMVLAACRSNLEIPDAVYKFAVFALLMRIGLDGGIELRTADPAAVGLPALMAAGIGAGIVLLGRGTLALLPGVKREDAIATAGLFGAVSASTLAAAMLVLEEEGIGYEAWLPALYPFMDIPALVAAIVLAGLHDTKAGPGDSSPGGRVSAVMADSLRGSAISALLLGLGLGLLARPDQVFRDFYDPLFGGFLSILMLILGMEAYLRLGELARVAHWYVVYAALAPLVHGLVGFGLGWVAHQWTGFSPGGVVLLAVLAGSSSDISGPPTLRAGIPTANPSAYIGASTSIGTPVAVVIGIPLYVALARAVFGL